MERFERFVEVDAPVERVFDMLSDFESYPRWMGGVRGVWRVDRRVWHWVVETALDFDVRWDAEVTAFVPDRRVAWRAVRGDVRADGEFVLAETPEGATLVRFVLGYDTPGGRTGARAARFFGRHPGRQLEADLAHFRRLAERGLPPRRRARAGREDWMAREESRRRGEDRRERPEERAEPRPRYAITPRERERAPRRFEEADYGRSVTADWYLRRGVDRLLGG